MSRPTHDFLSCLVFHCPGVSTWNRLPHRFWNQIGWLGGLAQNITSSGYIYHVYDFGGRGVNWKGPSCVFWTTPRNHTDEKKLRTLKKKKKKTEVGLSSWLEMQIFSIEHLGGQRQSQLLWLTAPNGSNKARCPRWPSRCSELTRGPNAAPVAIASVFSNCWILFKGLSYNIYVLYHQRNGGTYNKNR